MAGGTGGHIFPGLAVAKTLADRGWHVSWLGSKGGMEERLVNDRGIDLNLISISGLRGNGILGWLKAPFSLTKAIIEAAKVLRSKQPAVVIGFGGFASGPGGLAAWLTRKPLVLHEQNAIAGLTNKALSKIAHQLFQAFPGAFESGVDVETVGNPLRSEIVALNSELVSQVKADDIVKVLIIGGSRGALAFNQHLPKVLKNLLDEKKIKLKHQVGKNRLDETQNVYSALGLKASDNTEVVEFIDDMAEAFKWCDVVICRAGASTVSEVAAVGKCAIFIPFPYAVDDHQTANAKWLVSQQAAICVSEKDIKQDSFREEVESLINSPQTINQMAEKAKSCALLTAAEKVADYCDQFGRKPIGKKAA
ncbi:undecaprenyldiphospho-muramoylpentapeptide beta-N-acetylglucosaminyltransferase [Aliikangiella coralliicola]|uniref:UDP-N-acetylglucosamine--N-acetylmuramyl-(pentapeptide) pyrophosphoryl-undecaprenol N-acetylglucosamine transferase n=2 Tax=Aliikangiella coralliicola TaxID=2592383 RepID=A0A545UKA2_9GAMM|nr:undecaprenyldiphospho-muramoylpentapeptide beta-N-acetylglucosaminyltransferase [Aliikangiella coralliicola]